MNRWQDAKTNEYGETAVPGVCTIGDLTDRKYLAPVAIAAGWAFADSVFGRRKLAFRDDQAATDVFTDPPLATVGLSEEEAGKRRAVTVYALQFRPMAASWHADCSQSSGAP
jgi:glutathione reductase (NADPH)